MGSQRTERTFFCIGDAHDQLFGCCFALLLLQLGLQQAERQRRLSGSTRLGDIDDTEFLVLQQRLQLIEVIFADVLSCIYDYRFLAFQPCKTATQCVNHGFGAKIRTTDTDAYDHFAVCTQVLCGLLDICQLNADIAWQGHPAQEIVA